MKQLDKDIERKLYWLLVPLLLVALTFAADILLNLHLGSLQWVKPALLAGFLIPVIGFSIAYIRYKCWGLLAVTLIVAVIAILNMCNVFTGLLLPS